MGRRWREFVGIDPIKIDINNTNRQIRLSEKEIVGLEKDIQSKERSLFYLKDLKDQLQKEIKLLEDWKIKLTDKINKEE